MTEAPEPTSPEEPGTRGGSLTMTSIASRRASGLWTNPSSGCITATPFLMRPHRRQSDSVPVSTHGAGSTTLATLG